MGIIDELDGADGSDLPPWQAARLRELLTVEMAAAQTELGNARSGRTTPVMVVAVAADDLFMVLAPVSERARVDPAVVPDRALALVAAAVGALCQAADLPPVTEAASLTLRAGRWDRWLVLAVPARQAEGEVLVIALEDQLAQIDRLRTHVVLIPEYVVAGVASTLRPITDGNRPLRVAEVLARDGHAPFTSALGADDEERVLAVFGASSVGIRPHADDDPARGAARRILQRLDGMGKWGGYHTEFAHLSRGFASHERQRVEAIGEALLAAGLLVEKLSVGQRHVYLNPRRAADIYALIDEGEVPASLRLRAR